MEAELARVFFALRPDEACANQLHQIASDFAAEQGGRIMGKGTLHLTLAFVGDVGEERLADLLNLAGEVETAITSFEPVPLQMNRLGYWKHNHILWAGSDRFPPVLEMLADQMAGKLRARGYSLPIQVFSPHVTLVRKLDAIPEASRMDALQRSPVPWLYRDFVLLRSCRSHIGADYEALGSWSLGRRPAGGVSTSLPLARDAVGSAI